MNHDVKAHGEERSRDDQALSRIDALLILDVQNDFLPRGSQGVGGDVEVAADHASGLPSLNMPLARDLISRTRIAKLLAASGGGRLRTADGADRHAQT